MTAEIAIFNKTAIALAADSAATITSNGVHKKIYNGSEKLFTLSKHHPVGVMIYGNSEVCGAPWELLIKSFRAENKDTSYPTLNEWCQAFFNYASSNDKIITKQMRENYIMAFHFNDIMPGMFKDINKLAEEESVKIARVVTIDEYHSITNTYLDDFISLLNDCPYFEDFDENDARDSLDIISNYLDTLCNDFIISDDRGVPEEIKQKILTILSLTSTKKSPLGITSGIVFAGFGNDEYYPSILAFDVFGFLGNKVRKIFNITKSSVSSDANVIPYAQDQEVQLFLKGCYDDLLIHGQQTYANCHDETLSQVQIVLQESLSVELASELFEKIKVNTEGYIPTAEASVNSFINMNYNQKVMSMLSFLPKQELAYMAESLVNLTAFKRKVSDDHETVGGPIDVALISKTDGFIWVKRKHYFSPELNHHFFSKNE